MALSALSAALGVAIAIVLMFLGLGRMIEPEDSVKSRLDSLAPQPEAQLELDAGKASRWYDPVLRGIGRLISGRSFSTAMATDLARANLSLTVPEYALLHIVVAAVLFLVLLVLFRQVLLALPGAALGFVLPRLYLQRRQGKRLLAFQDQLPDVLTLLVGSLRSGYGITIAMDTVAKQMPPPTSEEFGRVVREVALGLSTTQALQNLVRRVRSDDLDLVVTAIAIQYEVGGNLASILETITGTIRERIRLKGQLRVLTAQQGLQRIILTILPVALGMVVYVMNPDYMRGLFTPGWTLLIPITAAVLLVLGYFVMGKLGKVEF